MAGPLLWVWQRLVNGHCAYSLCLNLSVAFTALRKGRCKSLNESLVFQPLSGMPSPKFLCSRQATHHRLHTPAFLSPSLFLFFYRRPCMCQYHYQRTLHLPPKPCPFTSTSLSIVSTLPHPPIIPVIIIVRVSVPLSSLRCTAFQLYICVVLCLFFYNQIISSMGLGN